MNFTILPILVVLAMGLMLTTGFHVVYKANTRGLGLVELAPWRQRLSSLVARVTGWGASIAAFFRTRQQLMAATLALTICLVHPSADAYAGLAIIGVAGTLNVAQLETDLKTKKAAVQTLIETQMRTCADHVVKAATATEPEVKGRLRTDEEKAAVQALLDEAKGIRSKIDSVSGDANCLAEIERLTAGMTDRSARTDRSDSARDRRSLGETFMTDPSIRAFLKAGGHQVPNGTQFTSPGVELPMSTLLDTSAGSGGPLIVPDYRPGVIDKLFARPVVADLIAPGTTDSNAIIYMKELTAVNAAAAVAQGAQKPESELTYEQATSPVVKIATWIPVTTEALDDIPGMQSMIDARLRVFLGLAEEDQLLNGSGAGANMRGLMNLTALAAAIARGADSSIDAIFKQISAIATNALIQPDGWVMNPINWLTIQLLKNAAGNYMGSGPWAQAQAPMLWGLPGAVTPKIVANTALVGAYRTCAQFFRKGGVKLALSNSHLDYFTTNKVAVLTEERGALAVYREAAFGKVTGLN